MEGVYALWWDKIRTMQLTAQLSTYSHLERPGSGTRHHTTWMSIPCKPASIDLANHREVTPFCVSVLA